MNLNTKVNYDDLNGFISTEQLIKFVQKIERQLKESYTGEIYINATVNTQKIEDVWFKIGFFYDKKDIQFQLSESKMYLCYEGYKVIMDGYAARGIECFSDTLIYEALQYLANEAQDQHFTLLQACGFVKMIAKIIMK